MIAALRADPLVTVIDCPAAPICRVGHYELSPIEQDQMRALLVARGHHELLAASS